jgi:hypothetical protein
MPESQRPLRFLIAPTCVQGDHYSFILAGADRQGLPNAGILVIIYE